MLPDRRLQQEMWPSAPAADTHGGGGDLAFFLGAGFAKWAADLPVADDLFDFRIKIDGIREESRLSRVKTLRDAWQAEHSEEPVEEFIRYASGRSLVHRDAVHWYVARRLSEPFIWREFTAQRWRRHVLMIDEHRAQEVGKMALARRLLMSATNICGIITTNYDMIVEYALGSARLNYGHRGQRLTGRGPYPVSQWRNPVVLKGVVPLAKLHGSISWDASGCFTDGRRGLTGKALIVPPSPEKDIPRELEPMWSLAASVLQRASHLLVFGFAFNPYDVAVLNLLATHGTEIKSVLIVDIRDRSRSARSLWPDALVSWYNPAEMDIALLHNWLGEA